MEWFLLNGMSTYVKCSNLEFTKDILMIDNNKKNSELVQEAQIYIHTW